MGVGKKLSVGKAQTYAYMPEKDEPEISVKKMGYFKRSFELSPQAASTAEEQIDTRKDPPPNEAWFSRLFVLRKDELLCYEESAPHRAVDNVISASIVPLTGTRFEKKTVSHCEAPQY